MRQGDVVRARFTPKRADDLRPGVAEWIGREITVRAGWVIDHECPYKGDWAMVPTADSRELPTGWIPLCDLGLLEVPAKEEP